MFGKSRITFFLLRVCLRIYISSYMIFLALVGNPDSGTEFIRNSGRLPEKIAHMGSIQHHPK
jgi:hypothetical protein